MSLTYDSGGMHTDYFGQPPIDMSGHGTHMTRQCRDDTRDMVLRQAMGTASHRYGKPWARHAMGTATRGQIGASKSGQRHGKPGGTARIWRDATCLVCVLQEPCVAGFNPRSCNP